VGGLLWVMPVLGPAQDEVNRRLARADGLQAEPDPALGGAINLVRPSLADPARLHAAHQATADQRASFEAFVAQCGLPPPAFFPRFGHGPGTRRMLSPDVRQPDDPRPVADLNASLASAAPPGCPRIQGAPVEAAPLAAAVEAARMEHAPHEVRDPEH
jgi:hypothetical protein